MRFDCEKIRSELSLQTVLDSYGINSLARRGNSLSGCCPIHHGDNPNAFHASLEKNLWNCFTRHHGGDVLSFIMEYEGVSFKEAVRIASEMISSPNTIRDRPKSPTENQREKFNPPLRFNLDLDPNHPYLKERGLEKSTIEHFGIGYCSKGIMRGRIAIPIHDENGNLIAYSGRCINGEKPKYKLPKGFNKMLVLYNLHRVKALYTPILAVVEGFFSACKVHQAGFQGVVALMGSSISEKQANLILSLRRKLIVLLDGDEAGMIGTQKIIEAFRDRLLMEVRYLPNGTQPDSLKENDLINLLRERGKS